MPTLKSDISLTFRAPPNNFFVKSSKRPILSAGFLSRRIPHPSSCCVARILHGMLVPNVATIQTGKGEAGKGLIEVRMNAPLGRRLVAVTLALGETLSFNLAYLVAFTRSLEMWTDIEFAWPSFGVDRVFIQNAKGPGRLVFEMHGEETNSWESNTRFSPSRLVAWTPTIGFEFCGVGSIWDIYLNELMIAATSIPEDVILLLDADAGESDGAGRRIRNLLKLIKRVYVPV